MAPSLELSGASIVAYVQCRSAHSSGAAVRKDVNVLNLSQNGFVPATEILPLWSRNGRLSAERGV